MALLSTLQEEPLWVIISFGELQEQIRGTMRVDLRGLHPKRCNARDLQLCFKCGEKYGVGHICKYKQVNFISACEEEEEDIMVVEMDSEELKQLGDNEVDEEFIVSALSKNNNADTISIDGNVQGYTIRFLMDTGSSGSFIDPRVVDMLKLREDPIRRFIVDVADGAEIRGSTICPRVSWMVQGHNFIFDLRVLALGNHDVILGTDWIKHLAQ